MRVLLIGATGVLGRRAVPALLAGGHEVTGLARDDDRAAVIARQGITPVVGDLFDPDSLAGVLPGQDAVLNLATRIPTKLGGSWAENDRIRRDGSAALVTAALACPDVRVLVLMGPLAVFARSQRIVSAKLTEATGWLPADPDPAVGWIRPNSTRSPESP